MHISVFTVAVTVSYTNEFRELFEVTTYLKQIKMFVDRVVVCFILTIIAIRVLK